jgi:hypothetical protein
LDLFEGRRAFWHPVLLIIALGVLGFFFAMVEIQIEGATGWAGNLPTWRIERHWMLDVFWGGRPMTGYHAWIFSFMALVFHAPIVIVGRWSWRLEARIVGCVMLFWIVEDLAWFLCNPAFGWSGLTPERVAWHRHWLLGVPLDYVTFSLIGGALITWSFRARSPKALAGDRSATPPADIRRGR